MGAADAALKPCFKRLARAADARSGPPRRGFKYCVPKTEAALSPEMAIRFEKAFGVPAATMLRMQAGWDLAQVELRADEIKMERWPEAA